MMLTGTYHLGLQRSRKAVYIASLDQCDQRKRDTIALIG